MNKDSHKDFKDLDPDDVIYVDEDQRPPTPPPVVEDPKDVAPIRPKAPVFDLPLVEESRVPSSLPEPKTPTKPEALDIPALETPEDDDRQAPVSQVKPAAQEQSAAPVAQDRKESPTQPSIPTLKQSPKPLDQPIEASIPSPSIIQPPSNRQLQDVQPRPATKPLSTESMRPVAPWPRAPKPILDIAPPAVQHLPAPARPPAMLPPPPPPPAPPAVPSTLQTPALVLPAPVDPVAASVAPQPPAPPPPPLVLPKSPLATTDLQGNWGSPSTLNQTPPMEVLAPGGETKPIDAASEPDEREESETEQELLQTAKRRGTQHLKVFGVVTLILILTTVVLGIIVLRPYVQDVLESKRSEDARIFEDVLVNLLQVDNQQMEIKISDKQADKIQPALESQADIKDGKVVVNNILKVDYATDFSNPAISSKFRFDLDLQTTKRDNFILDVVTVFNDEGAYFLIEGLSINGKDHDLAQTTFGRRWSNLEDLLQVQSSSEATALNENQSIILNYVANLLKLYSYPHYLFLLPVFNITQSHHYNAAREILLQSQAYYLQTNTCSDLQDTQRRCRLIIDYEQLYQLYVDIYKVLEVDLPSYYNILRTSDRQSFNLPETVELTFDTERHYPILIEAPVIASEISASSFVVSYEDFDISNLEIAKVSDPLALIEYHRQILEYEADKF